MGSISRIEGTDMIRLQCACGKAYQLKDEMGGKKVKCPACNGIMTVPVAAVLAEVPKPDLPAATAGFPPLDGLSPLPGGDLFAGLPPAAPLGPPLGSPNPGFAPPTPLGSAAFPATPRGNPLLWIIAGISGAVVLVALVVAVLVVIGVSATRRQAYSSPPSGMASGSNVPQSMPTGSAPTSSAPGAPGGGIPLPANSLQDQIKAPTVARDQQGRPMIGSQIGQWQLFTSEDGGYQINLPGKPQIVPQSLNTPNGVLSGSVAVVGSDASGLAIVITHMDVPFDASKVPIDKMTEMQIATQGGKILRTRDIQIAGKPGKEFLTEVAKAGFAGKAIFRSLGAGGRVFTLAYVVHIAKFDETKVAECLDSFQLTKEPPPPKSTGDQPFNGGIPIARDVQWTKQESLQFHFRVELPSTGTRMEKDAQEQGMKETWACEVAAEGGFAVNATAYPIPIPDEALANAVSLVKLELAKTLGQPVSESTNRQGPAQVCDFVFNHPVGMRTLVRGYLTSKVAYQLTWTGPPERASSVPVNRFFNSFGITAGGPGQPGASATTVPAAGSSWTVYEFKQHGAKAEFPGKPTPATAPGTVGDPGMDSVRCEIPAAGVYSIVAQSPVTALSESDLLKKLEADRAGIVGRAQAVVSESSRREDKFHVVEMVLNENDGSQTVLRLHYSAEWTFSVSWNGPFEQASSATVTRFLKSFTILRLPAKSP